MKYGGVAAARPLSPAGLLACRGDGKAISTKGDLEV